MSEQYQFLRYYIPGSLSLIYFFGLILASVGENVFQVLKNPALISLVVGVFAISPALGYVIYTFYDWTLYNRIARCSERRTLNLLDTWANEERFRRGERWEDVRRKELIDFALYSSLHDSHFRTSNRITETVRGFWNHVNARLVSATFVPIASFIFFALFVLLNPPISVNAGNTVFAVTAILVLSACIGFPARRTIREAFALEEYVIIAREQAVREYMRLDIEPQPQHN